MAQRRKWREWVVQFIDGQVRRLDTGQLCIGTRSRHSVVLTPTEARRLYTKLSGDFRD